MTKPAAVCLTSDSGVRAFLEGALAGFRLKFYASAAAFLKCPPEKGLAVIDSSLPDISGRDLVSVLRGDKKTSALLLALIGGGAYSPAAAALFLENGADEYFSFPPDARLFRARLLNLLARSLSNKSLSWRNFGFRAEPKPNFSSRLNGACKENSAKAQAESRNCSRNGLVAQAPRAGSGAIAAGKPAEYSFGALKISPEARTASVGAARIKLTALEFDLLLYFLKNQGRVASRTVLLERVWRRDLDAGPRAVDKRIEALRFRLGPFGSKIRTVFGLGYIFKM